MAYPTASGNVVSLGAYNVVANSTSVTVPATSNTYDTQLIVASVTDQAATISTVSGSGWTLLVSFASAASGATGRTSVYTRTGARASESITVTWGGAGATGIVHGVAISGQLDAYTTFASTSYGTSGTAPSVTATGVETLWIQQLSTANFPRVLAAPSGVTVVTSRHDYIVGSVVGSIQVGSGATGTSGAWNFTDPDTGLPASEAYESISFAFSIPAGGGTVSGTLSGSSTFGSGAYTYATTALSVVPASLSANTGDTPRAIQVLDQNGVPVQYATLSSSNTSVVTVQSESDSEGRATVVFGSAGSASITVGYSDSMSGALSTSVPVTVVASGITPPIASVTTSSTGAVTTSSASIQMVAPRVPLSDDRGMVNRDWYRFFAALQADSNSAREMATLRKRLSSTVLEATTGTQYTAPSGVRAQILAAVLCNSTAAAVTVSLWLVPPGGAADATNIVLSAQSLAAGESRPCPELVDQVLEAGGTLQARGAGVSLVVSGIEYN